METKDPNPFMNRLKLKEALYLMSQGEEVDQVTLQRILESVVPGPDSKIRIYLQFMNESLKVLMSDWENTTLHTAQMALRGQGNGGAFRVHRQVAGRDLDFVFQPNADKNQVFLSVVGFQCGQTLRKIIFGWDTCGNLTEIRQPVHV